MNVFHRYTRQALRKNRSRTWVTIVGIILSVALFTAVTEGAYSGVQYLVGAAEYTVGRFHGCYQNITEQQASQLSRDREITEKSAWQLVGWGQVGADIAYKPYLRIMSMDPTLPDLLSIRLTQGRLPEKAGELLLPEHLWSNGSVRHALGDTMELELGHRTLGGEELTVYDPYTKGETLTDTTPHTYTVVGFYQRLDMTTEPFSCPGYTALTCQEQGYQTDEFFRVAHPSRFYSYMEGNNEEYPGLEWFSNSDLLNYYGATTFFSVNRLIYSFAVILLLMISFGSVSLIYNSFSISVAERTRQFGILKSIGATRKQIRDSVLYEGTGAVRRGDSTGSAGGLSGHRHHSVLSAGQLRIPDGGERQRPTNALCAQRLGTAGGGGHRPCDGYHLGVDPRQACRAGVAGGGHPPDQGREAPGSGGQDIPPDGKALRFLRDAGRQELQTQPQALSLHGGGPVPQRDTVHLRLLLLRLSDGCRRPTGERQHTGRAAVLQRALPEGVTPEQRLGQLAAADGVESGFYTADSYASLHFAKEDMDPDYWKDTGLEGDRSAAMYFLRDEDFRQLLRDNGLPEEDYFRPDAPQAVAWDMLDIWRSTEGSKYNKLYHYHLLNGSSLPITGTESSYQPMDGWFTEGDRITRDGTEYVLYYPEDYIDDYYIARSEEEIPDESRAQAVPVSEAVLTRSYTVGAILKKAPDFLRTGDYLYLLYPYSMYEDRHRAGPCRRCLLVPEQRPRRLLREHGADSDGAGQQPLRTAGSGRQRREPAGHGDGGERVFLRLHHPHLPDFHDQRVQHHLHLHRSAPPGVRHAAVRGTDPAGLCPDDGLRVHHLRRAGAAVGTAGIGAGDLWHLSQRGPEHRHPVLHPVVQRGHRRRQRVHGGVRHHALRHPEDPQRKPH